MPMQIEQNFTQQSSQNIAAKTKTYSNAGSVNSHYEQIRKLTPPTDKTYTGGRSQDLPFGLSGIAGVSCFVSQILRGILPELY